MAFERCYCAVARSVPPVHCLQVYTAYQFFHEPVTADPSSPRNPLNIIRELARPQDFVAFKLDIDAPLIERRFIEQIMQVGAGYGHWEGNQYMSTITAIARAE